jgi:hypothetical protein
MGVGNRSRHTRLGPQDTNNRTNYPNPSYCAFFCLRPFRTFLLCAII